MLCCAAASGTTGSVLPWKIAMGKSAALSGHGCSPFSREVAGHHQDAREGSLAAQVHVQRHRRALGEPRQHELRCRFVLG